ncbi:hypothetical protein EZS27_009572 [termite gut metagenome]|uniref:HNH nuclease domain-containing protein n=1 Tax=termite gut metagenome TaxID=433724 RepID=A0A5J4SBK3_9ZZZZ
MKMDISCLTMNKNINLILIYNEKKTLIEGVSEVKAFIKRGDAEDTVRVLRELAVILRNRRLVDKLKKLYNHTCQLCGVQLIIDTNKPYSEIHHIIPLGKPHEGKDILENMIRVCPNCHVLLDFKAIRLEPESLNAKHYISKKSIEHHNSQVRNK